MVRDAAAWAARPCSRRWRVHRRPCPWFLAGHDCRRTWVSFAAPAETVSRAVLYANLVATATLLACFFRRSRRARSAHAGHHQTASSRCPLLPCVVSKTTSTKKKAPPALNTYEKAALLCLASHAAQAVAFADVTGGARALPLWPRMVSQCLFRFCFQLVIFLLGTAYRDALVFGRTAGGSTTTAKPKTTTTRSASSSSSLRGALRRRLQPPKGDFAVAAGIGLAFTTVVCVGEHLDVPRAARRGCFSTVFNGLRHVGTGAIEAAYVGRTLKYAVDAKRRLSSSHGGAARTSESQPCARPSEVRTSLSSSERAIDAIVARVAALCAGSVLAVCWGVYVIIRNAGQRHLCEQPTCTHAAYAREAFWAYAVVAVDWCCVVILSPWGGRCCRQLYSSHAGRSSAVRGTNTGLLRLSDAGGVSPLVAETSESAPSSEAVAPPPTTTTDEVEEGSPGSEDDPDDDDDAEAAEDAGDDDDEEVLRKSAGSTVAVDRERASSGGPAASSDVPLKPRPKTPLDVSSSSDADDSCIP